MTEEFKCNFKCNFRYLDLPGEDESERHACTADAQNMREDHVSASDISTGNLLL
jgi:hypothetical protein